MVGLAGLVAVITVAVIALPSGITPPPVLIGELIALALFLAFWALQSYQTWVDDERGWRGLGARSRA